MSGGACKREPFQGVDIPSQGPESFASKSLDVGFKNDSRYPYEGQLHSNFSEDIKKNVLSSKNGKDGPLDLSVKKGVKSSPQILLRQKQFSSPSNAVPTIFTTNPEDIFKIPLPPELTQDTRTIKNSRLGKAVKQTFEFRHQVPFLASQPSVFQRKYSLFTSAAKSSFLRLNPVLLETSSGAKHHRPEEPKVSLKKKAPMMESETPQKQARIELDNFEMAPHVIKIEPMENVDLYQDRVYPSSKTYADFSSSNGHASNSIGHETGFGGFNAAVNTKGSHGQQLCSTPDSSTDSIRHSCSDPDITNHYHLTSERNRSAYQQALGMSGAGFGEVIIKQDNTIDSSQHHLSSTADLGQPTDVTVCQVCGDQAAGFYCGAYICEACKKFFIRASKLKQIKYVCLKQKNCIITKESRVHCQFCRYQKCLSLHMLYHKDGQRGEDKSNVQEIPCRVCSAPSSGFHFGALTCEGCKGFFRRMVNERDPGTYICGKGGNCEVNSMTRNMCKACRYAKCLQIGMCIEGSRIGRQPNAVKHAISLEVKKQAAQRESSQERKYQSPLNQCREASTYNFEGHVLQSSAAEEMEKIVTREGLNVHRVSADKNGGYLNKTDQRNCNHGSYSWRESKEKESMMSSSTESLDMVGSSDMTISSSDAEGQCGVRDTAEEYLKHKLQRGALRLDTQLKNEAHTHCCPEGEQNYTIVDSNKYGDMFHHSSSHVSESARRYAPGCSESQRQHYFLDNSSGYAAEKNKANRSKDFNHKLDLSVTSSLEKPVSFKERRFSEDLELMNLNISMQNDNGISHRDMSGSFIHGHKVLGMTFTGSLPSFWNSSEEHNHHESSMHHVDLPSEPRSRHSFSHFMPKNAAQPSNSASLKHNHNHHKVFANVNKKSGSTDFQYAGQPDAQFHAFYQKQFYQGMEGEQHLDKKVGIEQINSNDQSRCYKNSYNNNEGRCQMEAQSSRHTWQTGHQMDSSSCSHHRQEAVIQKRFEGAFGSQTQGGLQTYGNSEFLHEQKIENSLKSHDSLKSESMYQVQTPSNRRDSCEQAKWQKDERHFQTPISSQMRSTSPCVIERKYRNIEERSQSTNPSNPRWKQQESQIVDLHRDSLHHNYDSLGGCKPDKKEQLGHDNKGNGRITPIDSSRSCSMDRSTPSQCIKYQTEVQPASAGTSPHCSTECRSSASPISTEKSPGKASPSPVASSDPANITDFNGTRSSSSTPLQLSPSSSKVWNFTNAYIDQEMEEAAKILRSICLVDQAKKDIFQAERLINRETGWELMMEHFHFHAKWMVRYAKKAPGFRDLKLDDQVKLLKAATYSLVLLNHTRAYEPETGFYNYFNMYKKDWTKSLRDLFSGTLLISNSDGFTFWSIKAPVQAHISMKPFENIGLTDLQDHFPEFRILHSHFKHCGILAKELALTEIEYGYMSTMLLLDDADCEGLEDPQRVKELKDIMMAAFQQYELDNFPNGSLRFGQMLLRLSEFSQFSMQHNVVVVQVITRHPNLHIPELYAEMFT